MRMADDDEEDYLSSNRSYQISLPTIPSALVRQEGTENDSNGDAMGDNFSTRTTRGAWKEETDPQTGTTFYHNTVTLESRWERPADIPTAGADANADTSPDSITTPSHLDSSSANPSTLQAKMQREGTSLVSLAPALIRAKRKWRALVDSNTGSTYYVDEATGVSQWEQPSPEEITLSTETVLDSPTKAILTPSPYHQAHQAETSLVGVVPALLRAKERWRNLVDTNTGSTYYVNEDTGATQWDKPPEIDRCQAPDDGDTVQDPQMETSAVVGAEAATGAPGENENEDRNALATGGSTDQRSDALETPRVVETDDVSKLAGTGEEVPANGQAHDNSGGGNTSTSSPDPFLQRVGSNSTLSTYGGELDSLAKYVTGHSSTLDRGAVVSIEVPSEDRESASPADIEEASHFTDTESSGGNNHTGTGSERKNSDEETSKHSTSSRHASIAEQSTETPSSGVDAGDSIKEEPCAVEEQQQDQTTETTANSSVSSSVQSVRQPLMSVVSVDSLGQATAPLPSADDLDAKEQGTSIGQQHSPPQEERPGSEAESTSRLAEEDGTEGDAGNVSTAQDFDESDDLRRRSSPPGEPVTSSGNEGTAGVLHKERPAGKLSAPDLGPIKVASEPSSTSDASPVEDVLDGDDESLHVVPSAAKQPSRLSFDDVAAATVALQRLQAGMLRRRQCAAIVKLQAQARGWAARRLYSRLVERGDTRRREEREAKQRAATTIQAVVRGRMGRREALLWQAQRDSQHSRNMLKGSDSKSDENERERITTSNGMDDLDDVYNIQGTVVLLQSKQECNVEDIAQSPCSVPEETTAKSTTGGGQEEAETYDGSVDGEASANGWNDRADLIDSNNNRTSEEGSPSREDGHTYALSEHEHSSELDRDRSPVGIDAYGGMGTGYESEPLGTIDEEGYQRNGYLWGGGGATPEEPNPEVLSSDGDGPPGNDYDTAVSSPKGSERQQDADASEDGRSASDNAYYGFDHEESTEDVTDTDDNDSDERIHNSSRTTMSSERTSGEGGIPSDLTASEGDDDHSGSSSEDGYLRQHSVRTEEEEAQQQQQQQQQPPKTTFGDDKTAGGSAGVDREMDIQSEGNISRTNGGELDYEGEEMESLEHEAEEEKARKGIYLDTTAPLESLEELRTLVVAQAQAAARATMTAAGTDASKREAIRIRDLAAQQAQAAASFREAIRHSIAVDDGDDDSSTTASGASPLEIGVVETSPCLTQEVKADEIPPVGMSHNPPQPSSDLTTEDGEEGGRRKGKSHMYDADNRDKDKEDRKKSDRPPTIRQDELQDTCDTTTSGAAHVLASDVSRLASRQSEVASEVLQEPSSEDARGTLPADPRTFHRKFPKVLEALAVLGPSVGLQAKAVGLMEEVVERTDHSRIDARIEARAARKGRIGRLAESLAEDAKLVAARHQHTAARMEVAPDPATARFVADDIRRLTLVQEKLAYRVQQFILTASGAVFNSHAGEDNPHSINNVQNATIDNGSKTAVSGSAATVSNAAAETNMSEASMKETTTTETAQGRLGRLAAAVVKELRSGVDIGSVAAARAQAIRRGSQAGRLADELRLIASGQAAASLALGDAGAQLIADAEAEKPIPREYALSRSSSTHDHNPLGRTHCGKLEEINCISEIDRGDEGDSRGKGPANAAAVVVGHNDNEHDVVVIAPETASIVPNGLAAGTGDEFGPRGPSLPPAAVSVAGSSMAIEMAAQEEEIAAASRIQSFLRRRRRQGRLGIVPGGLSTERATVVPVLPSAANSSGELCNAGSSRSRATADWFVVALRSLRREVDNFLLGGTGVDVVRGGSSDDGSAAPSVSDLGENAGDSGSDEDIDKADGVDGDSDNDGDDTEPESSEDCPDYDWPTFPPVPLRARAPSLYTLPPPSSGSLRRKPRDSSERAPGVPASKGPFTKLDPEVAARLNSASSVFCLRASDVLTAFSPPPPPPSSSRLIASTATSSDSLPRSRPSAIPGTSAGREGTGGFRRLSSPEALRQRLRVEAQDASLAGLGRPWLLSSRAVSLQTRHKQEQQRSAFLRKKGNSGKPIGMWGGCGGIDQVRGKRRRTDAFGPLTPLGQRLARRYNAGVAARRRRIIGETDAFRAVHVGRQLRIGASLNALERVERALDARLSCAREATVSSAHIAELLDVVGRFVFSDSQLCGQRTEAASTPSGGEAVEGIAPQRSRCRICQELLEDLRQKFPVVREQSSWGNETNPFCCDRRWQGSPRIGSPEWENNTITPTSTDDPNQDNANDGRGNDAYNMSLERVASTEGAEEAQSPPSAVVGTTGLRVRNGDDAGASYGGAAMSWPSPSENAGGKNCPRPGLLPPVSTPGSVEEDTPATGSVRCRRGAAGLMQSGAVVPGLERRGSKVGAKPPPKPDAVAAAFSAHLHGVDKYPLELARLCRFAQFLTENELLREAYEVILHILSSFTTSERDGISGKDNRGNYGNSNRGNEGKSRPATPPSSWSFSPLPALPTGLRGQLLVVAGRLAVATGRYPQAVRHVKEAVRTVTDNSTKAGRDTSPAVLVSASEVFEYLLDFRSAEIILLGCLLHDPDYKPALSSYGRLAARKGELSVAERYLTRATSLSGGRDHAAKGGERGGKTAGVGAAEDWLTLMKFYAERTPSSARATDTLTCFRKVLSCLDWTNLEQQRVAQSLPRKATATAAPQGGVDSTTSPQSSSETFDKSWQPRGEILLELGRFELVHNRSIKRASAFFRACLRESPWHASAKVHLAVCMLEQLGPFKDGRPPSRATMKIDSLLRSVLNFNGYGHVTRSRTPTLNTVGGNVRPKASAAPPSSPTLTPTRIRGKGASASVGATATTNHAGHNTPIKYDATPRSSSVGAARHGGGGGGGRGIWLLWLFYAKFAERCLKDPQLALFALNRAAAAAASLPGRLGQYRSRRGLNPNGGTIGDGVKLDFRGGAVPFTLVARAQFCQRWPKLSECIAGSSGGGGDVDSSPEESLMDAAMRQAPLSEHYA
ncbi:conserved unknown protein [Ectocarpus siliculosus]|uniref:WW domain-containing protein n=1 Tax=Ectocarpus siliculosus TaxID=2880 RepID=D8LEU6_ECTSI|nr:conserved unknown protein [Ectocarpus siliculosus]|eukprot:CBN79766.1 conserved unknown protein [Ectocarpus siliculosus]